MDVQGSWRLLALRPNISLFVLFFTLNSLDTTQVEALQLDVVQLSGMARGGWRWNLSEEAAPAEPEPEPEPSAEPEQEPEPTTERIVPEGLRVDTSVINMTMESFTTIIRQVNATVENMSMPVEAALDDWSESLARLREKYAKLRAVALSSDPSDGNIGSALDSIVLQMKASINSAAEQLEGARALVDKSLAMALHEFTMLGNNAFAAIDEAEDQIAKLSNAPTTTFEPEPESEPESEPGAMIAKAIATAATHQAGKAVSRIAHEPSVLLEARAAAATEETQNIRAAGDMDSSLFRKGQQEPDAAIKKVNATIDELVVALNQLNDKTVPDAFASVTNAVNKGMEDLNETAQDAFATTQSAIASEGGAQAIVAQQALDGINTSLESIIGKIQAGVTEINTAGSTAVAGLVEDASDTVKQAYAITAFFQEQADAAAAVAAAAQEKETVNTTATESLNATIAEEEEAK